MGERIGTGNLAGGTVNATVCWDWILSEATQGKSSAVADKRIAKPLSQGLLTQGLVVK
jgi:hypothetical protein